MSRRYECVHCAQQFTSVTDHMTHVVQQHDTGFITRQSGRRLRRNSHCPRCATEIPAAATHCDCGAINPQQR